MTDWETLYVSVIEKTIENVLKAPGSTAIRRDVIDSIKRRWISALTEVEDSGRGSKRHVTDSDPSTVDRTKYTTHKPSNAAEVSSFQSTSAPQAESEDEFADEFGESEFVHATAVGKKLAESAKSVVESKGEPKKALAPAGNEKKSVILNAEELDESLADAEYDNIQEPVDCGIRVFGQTEVCESIVGPRRSDSRWMVTIMNGFVRVGDALSGEEIPFRTANQTMSHYFHQF